jgi:phosphatidylglycerophosphate synthase
VAIVMFLVKDSAFIAALGPQFEQFFQAASWLVMGAAVVLTILSMVDYFRHASKVIVGPWSSGGA